MKKTFIHINLIVRDSFTANLIKFTLTYLNPLTATDETRHKKDFFPHGPLGAVAPWQEDLSYFS